ncbi:MAG TPA: hypothetical protein VM008_13835 [Phycisphaerae bacterium]|nr:hypothetical protein [Phycisphaerae bacterium]
MLGLPEFVLSCLRRTLRQSTRSASFAPVARAPMQPQRTLIYPVMVVDHSMISADARRAASRPAGVRIVLVDDDLDPAEISDAASVAAVSKGALPTALHVRRNDAGEVNVKQTRLTIPQVMRIVQSAAQTPQDSRIGPETRNSGS